MAEPRISKSHVPQPECGELNGRFSPASRQRVQSYLASFTSFEPTLVLLYGDSGGSATGSWSMQAVSESMVTDLAHRYAGFGAVICYDLDGIRVVVPQLAHIQQLNRGLLEFHGNRLRASGVTSE